MQEHKVVEGVPVFAELNQGEYYAGRVNPTDIGYVIVSRTTGERLAGSPRYSEGAFMHAQADAERFNIAYDAGILAGRRLPIAKRAPNLQQLRELYHDAQVPLPVGTGDISNREIADADRTFILYDEGGHTEAQARYLAALLNAAPALLFITTPKKEN